MTEPTDEELTAIYNEANAGKSVAWSMANGCFAAMRLAMERVRKEQKEDAERWRKFASSPQTAQIEEK